MKYFTQIIFSQTRKTTDPLGGFFLFKKEIIQAVDFEPRGFKILVEILMRAKYESVRDVPYKFLKRENDVSKASLRQGIEFLKHLWFLFCTLPHAGRFIKFCFVGLTGVIINIGTLYALVEFYGFGQFTAWLIAILLSILSNFVLNSSITYSDRITDGHIERIKQLLKYCLLSMVVIVFNFVIYRAALMFGLYYLFAAMFGILLATLLNYIISSSLVWSLAANKREVLSQENFFSIDNELQ